MQYELQCALCKHLQPNRKCKAFAKKIPDEIFAIVEHDHTKPFPGDNGILFESINQKKVSKAKKK